MVWLKGDYIYIKQSLKKLNNKLYDPFPIEKIVYRDRAYKLILLDLIVLIYPVFNILFFKKYYYLKKG